MCWKKVVRAFGRCPKAQVCHESSNESPFERFDYVTLTRQLYEVAAT